MLLHDVRYAVRSLRKARTFSAAAVLTMALGIAANTTIFSAVNAVLIRSLPFADPDRLVQVAERNDKLDIPFFSASALNYLSWKEQARSLDMGAFGYATYTLTGREEPEQVTGGPISPSLVPLLGLQPVAGRSFREGEDAPGSPPVVLISEALWKRRFGGDRGVLNEPLLVSGIARTLVGVMGPELNQLTGGDLWVPMVIDQTRENRLSHVISVVGRLRSGVTMAAAQSEMDEVNRRVVQEFPDVRDWTIRLRTFSAWFVGSRLRTALLVLMGAVVLVLLLVCANVANLLLSRAVTRQRELAIRAAMGAGRVRLARQVLTEGLLLALTGGAIGLLLAAWAIALFNSLPPARQPITGVRLDATVVLFTLGASVVAGVLFGLLPAWQGARTDLHTVLKQGARTSRGHTRPWIRNGQAAGQLVFATVLVVGAGLLVQSLLRLQRVPLGFDGSNAVTFRLSLPASRYPNHTASWAFYKDLLAAIERVPGVRGVAMSSGLPFGAGAYTRTPVTTPSRSALPPGTAVPIDWRVVSPGFFRVLGIPLLQGRDFSDQDSATSPPVMVVSRSLARKFFGNDNPIGKVLHLVNARGAVNADYTVVGVVGDVRSITLNEERPAMYYSSSYRLWPAMEIAVRTHGVPEAILPAVRRLIRSKDPDLPLSAVQTIEDGIAASVSQPRFNAVLLLVFAGAALVIAAIGVYGVLAYSVSHRTHEIGLRMALGARRGTVMRLIVGEGMAVGVSGIGIGLVAAVAASRVLTSLLFGIEARDAATFVGAAVVLTAVVAVACAVPAWQASRVDPVIALRAD